jgi:hypothetical protein
VCRSSDPGLPSSSLLMSMPVNWRTMSGPFTKAYPLWVTTTKSMRPSNNAGPDTAGPSRIAKVGTTPEHLVSTLATRPHPCSAAMPSPMSAPALFTTATNGMRSSKAVRAPTSRAIAWYAVRGAAGVGAVELHERHATSAEEADPSG